jgi:hypothetical protein
MGIAALHPSYGLRATKRRPLVKAFRAKLRALAQPVEQMTLNHRVPGSSPGAPTKLFKDLAVFQAFRT